MENSIEGLEAETEVTTWKPKGSEKVTENHGREDSWQAHK